MPPFYHKPVIYLGFGILLLLSTLTLAQEPEQLTPLPPPALPEQSDVVSPDIEIIQRDDAKIKEYRINGRLYLIKVTPRVGPSYYLVDADGDGYFESHFDGPVGSDMLIPSWVFFRW